MLHARPWPSDPGEVELNQIRLGQGSKHERPVHIADPASHRRVRRIGSELPDDGGIVL